MHQLIEWKGARLTGNVYLPGSKSISNRLLIIRALSGQDFPILGLSEAEDTVILERLLNSESGELDAGAAGTTFRFLTAYLAFREGTQLLIGSERMKERPIGILVDALRILGAEIQYVGQEGFPPIRLHSPKKDLFDGEISIKADVSSQFISALLMIGPILRNGLTMTLEGEISSMPYIRMTLELMKKCGASFTLKNEKTIRVEPKPYSGKEMRVETDWSAASYFYSMVALSANGELFLDGLQEESLQGDSVMEALMRPFGVETNYSGKGIRIKKAERSINWFEQGFLECPDIVQTMAVLCAGLGVPGIFRHLFSLRIKETDRIAALQNELQKVGVSFVELQKDLQYGPNDQAHSVQGRARLPEGKPLQILTYKDHRMAMAFSPLALLGGKLLIEDPEVVKKSYPGFWRDLEKIGFSVKSVSSHF